MRNRQFLHWNDAEIQLNKVETTSGIVCGHRGAGDCQADCSARRQPDRESTGGEEQT